MSKKTRDGNFGLFFPGSQRKVSVWYRRLSPAFFGDTWNKPVLQVIEDGEEGEEAENGDEGKNGQEDDEGEEGKKGEEGEEGKDVEKCKEGEEGD